MPAPAARPQVGPPARRRQRRGRQRPRSLSVAPRTSTARAVAGGVYCSLSPAVPPERVSPGVPGDGGRSLRGAGTSLVFAEVLQRGGQVQAVDGQAVHDVLLDDQPAQRLQRGHWGEDRKRLLEGLGLLCAERAGGGLPAGPMVSGSIWGVCLLQGSSRPQSFAVQGFRLCRALQPGAELESSAVLTLIAARPWLFCICFLSGLPRGSPEARMPTRCFPFIPIPSVACTPARLRDQLLWQSGHRGSSHDAFGTPAFRRGVQPAPALPCDTPFLFCELAAAPSSAGAGRPAARRHSPELARCLRVAAPPMAGAQPTASRCPRRRAAQALTWLPGPRDGSRQSRAL